MGKSPYGPVLLKAGVPHGLVLGPLFFLTYISDSPKGLSSNAKLFADDTLFSRNHDISSTRNELYDDLVKINT